MTPQRRLGSFQTLCLLRHRLCVKAALVKFRLSKERGEKIEKTIEKMLLATVLVPLKPPLELSCNQHTVCSIASVLPSSNSSSIYYLQKQNPKMK